jgi:hypothetical protein
MKDHQDFDQYCKSWILMDFVCVYINIYIYINIFILYYIILYCITFYYIILYYIICYIILYYILYYIILYTLKNILKKDDHFETKMKALMKLLWQKRHLRVRPTPGVRTRRIPETQVSWIHPAKPQAAWKINVLAD